MADDAPMPSVSTQVTWIVVGYAVLVAVLAVVSAVRGHERPSWLDQMVWMLELLLVVRALIGLGPLVGEDKPSSTSTYVGYLAASVCVLGALLAVAQARLGRLSRSTQIALVFGLSMKHTGLALVLAGSFLADQPRVILVVLLTTLAQHIAAGAIDLYIQRARRSR